MDEKALKQFFLELDRSLFVNPGDEKLAHIDSPLHIGFGQTISQPTLVHEMTRLLSPERDSRVLEIGTGSGYQTAMLAQFAQSVYTIEVIAALSERAQKLLNSLGYDNIHFKIADGSEGWQGEAPFDRIMVTAAAGRVPTTLLEQLNANGHMIVPVGSPYLQDLLLITKDEAGEVSQYKYGKVRFVEMIGDFGWNS